MTIRLQQAYKIEDLNFEFSNYSFPNFIYDTNIHEEHMANMIIKDNHMYKLVPANLGYYSKKEQLVMSERITSYNARNERLESSPIWSKAYKTHHCLIPVSAFYTWVSARPQNIPHAYNMKDNKVFYLAGLYRQNPRNHLYSFAIITGDGSEKKRAPKRYPIIIENKDAFDWLAYNDNGNFFNNSLAQKLSIREISRRVNHPEYKDLEQLYHVKKSPRKRTDYII